MKTALIDNAAWMALRTGLRRTSRKGQAVVEFALTVPFFLMLLLAGVEFGVLINGHMVLANAAREGARAAALGQNITTVNSRIISMAGRLEVDGNAIRVEYSADQGQTWTRMAVPAPGVAAAQPVNNPAANGDLVRVQVTVSYKQLTNFVPGMNGLQIVKTVTMRREPT
jgi:Flp pilus assembly protein TadG